jgi:hypothetical protein
MVCIRCNTDTGVGTVNTVLSPKLFTCLLEHVCRKLNWSNKRDLINSGKLTNIRSANNSGDTQETVNGSTKLNIDAGLKINRKETEVMTNSADTYMELN